MTSMAECFCVPESPGYAEYLGPWFPRSSAGRKSTMTETSAIYEYRSADRP